MDSPFLVRATRVREDRRVPTLYLLLPLARLLLAGTLTDGSVLDVPNSRRAVAPAYPTRRAARSNRSRVTATFREQLVLLVCERLNAEDVVERSTTRPSLDEVRDAQLSMVAASVSCVARPPYSK